MIRRFLLLLLLIIPSLAYAQAPTKLEFTGSPYYAATNTVATWKIHLPNPTASGDGIIAYCVYSTDTRTVTFTDDQSNTWTTDKKQADSGSAHTAVSIGHSSNVAAGTTIVTATFSAAITSGKCGAIVMNNMATASAVDVSCGAVVASTSLACGSMTTTVNNDFIVQVGSCDFCTVVAPMTFTSGGSFNLLLPDGSGLDSAQYFTQSTLGAINPTMTLSVTPTSAVTAGVAYKSATSGGSGGTGIYVTGVQRLNLPEQAAPTATSFTFQTPCPSSSNLMALTWQSNTRTLTGVSSANPTATWTKPNSPVTFPNAGATQSTGGFYTLISPTTTTTTTLTLDGTVDSTNEAQFEIYCISGADGSTPYDTNAKGTGNDASTTFPRTLTGVLSITTANNNELVLFIQNEDSQTCNSTNIGTDTQADIPSYANIWTDQDACIVHVYAATAGAQSFNTTYTKTTGSGNGAIQNWTNVAMAFKAPAGGATVHCNSISLLGVGCQ